MIRVGVLTSSRADYGIYLPLLKALNSTKDFELKLIVFGTHLSKFHGYTLNQIEADGFVPYAKIESLLIGDTPNAISSSFSLTALKFADFWEKNKNEFELVIALGDRFEMAAAVLSAVPFGIKFAHLHGGETTLGAIDNIFRHSISLASEFHFVATEPFAKRIEQLIDVPSEHIYNIGSLSLENLDSLNLLSLEQFFDKWGIDLSLDSLLVTVHPETISIEENINYCLEITNALRELSSKFQVIITMPNADTSGLIYRDSFERLAKQIPSIKLIENFGTQSYFTCMKYVKLLIGNTSSGILEAASFQKYVLNLGDRQKGRLCNSNVIHLNFNKDLIVQNALKYSQLLFNGENIYYKKNPSLTIIEVIKNAFK